MCHAILERGDIEVELGAASKAPEEVRIDGSKMVKKTIRDRQACRRQVDRSRKLLLCERPHGFLRARAVANPWGAN